MVVTGKRFWVGYAMASCFALAGSALAGTLAVTSSPGGEYGDIAAAIDAAREGDTISVGPGRYRLESALTVAKCNLRLIGVAGQPPVLLAGEDVPAALSIVASGVVLQDLVIQGGFYGVKVDQDNGRPTRGVVIRNCIINSTAADGIKAFQADDLRIEYCQIGPTGLRQNDNAEGIDVIGCRKVLIRGCVIERTATNGIYLKGGTSDGVVERCLVRNAGHGGILLGQDTDPQYMRDHARFEASDCIARNNIIVHTNTAGLGTYSGSNITFANNTLVDVASTGQAAIWIVTNSREVPAENIALRNNIIASSGVRPAIFIKDAAGLPDSDHNLFWSGQSKPRIVREIGADASLCREWDIEQWRQSTAMDLNSRQGDPLLDPLRFSPGQHSPAIGGAKQIRTVTDDYYGRRRTGWDIGAVAFEVERAVARSESVP